MGKYMLETTVIQRKHYMGHSYNLGRMTLNGRPRFKMYEKLQVDCEAAGWSDSSFSASHGLIFCFSLQTLTLVDGKLKYFLSFFLLCCSSLYLFLLLFFLLSPVCRLKARLCVYSPFSIINLQDSARGPRPTCRI